MKKQYTPEFKAKVVAETLKEEKSLSEIAAEYGVHPAQVSEWRKMDLEKLPDVFVDERKAAKEKKAQEQKIDRLFSQVGKLTTGGYHRLGYIASWQLDQTLMKKPWLEMKTLFGKRTESSNDCVWIIRAMR
jgi:transposase